MASAGPVRAGGLVGWGEAEAVAKSKVDFDGDGIADTLIGYVPAPTSLDSEPTGSHTAIVRSGRDGRVIWKSIVDPIETWFSPTSGNAYSLSAFPLPVGDFDGDGVPDVIVMRTRGSWEAWRSGGLRRCPSSFSRAGPGPGVVSGHVARRVARESSRRRQLDRSTRGGGTRSIGPDCQPRYVGQF